MMFAVLLLATLAVAAPPSTKKLIIDDSFFPDCHVIYNSTHDIVDISVPLNDLNFGEDLDKIDDDHVNVLFFVEADIKENGDKDFKGVYVFKNGQSKKLLDNGQSVTFSKDETVYFGAKDGIYKYNVVDVTAEKFGNITDSVIKMVVDVKNAYFYYLTEDYILYKFDTDKLQSSKVEIVKDARDIVYDFYGNLIFYDGTKQVYIYNGRTVEKVEDLKSNPTTVYLVKAPVTMKESGAIVDGTLYSINENGTSENTNVEFRVIPTAYAPDAGYVQYYGYNKKIYKYTFKLLSEDCKIETLESFIIDKGEDIKNIKIVRKPFNF